MDNKTKTKVITIMAIILIIVMAIGATYAYFRAQGGTTVTRNVNITTHTVDTLTFNVSDNISIEATQQNFTELDSNLSDEATTTAILTPNSKTGSASKNYYIYLKLSSNQTVYSEANTNNAPELLLQVFDSSNQLVALTGLGNQKTVDSLTGYDITGKNGLFTLLDNHAISASNNTATTENYRVVITLINHDFDQYENTGKQVTGNIIVSETQVTYCDAFPNDFGCNYSLTYNPATTNTITLTGTGIDGYLYHHDSTLTNGANDGSYRYAGANPNNYICFGSDAATCPDNNIYRIIGYIPVDVVVDETNPNNSVTERQMLYKIIKKDYEIQLALGITSVSNASKYPYYDGPEGNLPSGDIQGFKWTENNSGYDNTWSLSTLNTTGLNTNAYAEFSNTWQEKIAKVKWKVGGHNYIRDVSPMSIVYTNEILNSGIAPTSNPAGSLWYYPQDNKNEYIAKIGLMYVSDYSYAAPQNRWNIILGWYNSNSGNANNWLYKGITEWTITRDAGSSTSAFFVHSTGGINAGICFDNNAVRRVFYLTEDTTIDMTTHAGTLEDPYRIS